MLFFTTLQPQIHCNVKYACVLPSNSIIKFKKKMQHNNEFSNLYIPFLPTVSLKTGFSHKQWVPTRTFQHPQHVRSGVHPCSKCSRTVNHWRQDCTHVVYSTTSCMLSTLPVCGALKSPNVKKRLFRKKRCLSVER
jgi:hypothetical protein